MAEINRKELLLNRAKVIRRIADMIEEVATTSTDEKALTFCELYTSTFNICSELEKEYAL